MFLEGKHAIYNWGGGRGGGQLKICVIFLHSSLYYVTIIFVYLQVKQVVSLFTSIPVDVAVNVAHNRLVNDQNLPERTALSVTDVLNYLISACQTPTFMGFQQPWVHPFPP